MSSGDKIAYRHEPQEPGLKMPSVDLSPEERAKIVAERADVKHGPFASQHEAYGVLLEETYECNSALDAYNQLNDDTPEAGELMAALHANNLIEFVRVVEAGRAITRIKLVALDAIKDELIDSLAVCDRIIAQWGEKDGS